MTSRSKTPIAPQVILSTTSGIITLQLDPEKAPQTVENFLQYVASGHYDGTIFHRVIPGFMIQGGGFATGLQEKSVQAPIKNEAQNGLKNTRYSIAMARTTAPHSATAQFFINVNDNDFLDYPGQDGWGYCVFGTVITGQATVDDISKVATGKVGMFSDVPRDDVVLRSATLAS